MNINVKNLPEKITPVIALGRKYLSFIFFISILIGATFLVLRVNQYSKFEPSDEAIEEKLQTVQRPKVDQSVLDKIQQLQDQNVQVQTLFDQARNNPFNE